ncbi:hypothetical protein FG05_35097 [Fusarium graminearum]|nr:hypothetical protein FG05_35097 [Fusarium graminearum]
MTASNNGWTPLNSASNSGYAEVVKILLEKGADFMTASNDGWTPLNSASDSGHAEVVKFLFEASSFDTTEMDSFGRTALFLASRQGRLSVVQYLLSTSAFDPDTKNYYGSTAFSAAVANGHYEVVELLLSTGVSTQEQLHAGRSLMWWACRTGKPQLIELLSQHMGLGETFPQHDSFSSKAIFDTESLWRLPGGPHSLRASGLDTLVDVMTQSMAVNGVDDWRYPEQQQKTQPFAQPPLKPAASVGASEDLGWCSVSLKARPFPS